MLGLVAPLLLFWAQPGRRVDLPTAPAALRGVSFRTSDALPNPQGASGPKAVAEQRVNKTFALAAVLDMSRSGANADYDTRRVHECSGPLQANDLWTSPCHQRLSSSLKDGVTAVDGQVRRRRPRAFALSASSRVHWPDANARICRARSARSAPAGAKKLKAAAAAFR